MANNFTVESLRSAYYLIEISGSNVTNLTDFEFYNIELIKQDNSQDISSIIIYKSEPKQLIFTYIKKITFFNTSITL